MSETPEAGKPALSDPMAEARAEDAANEAARAAESAAEAPPAADATHAPPEGDEGAGEAPAGEETPKSAEPAEETPAKPKKSVEKVLQGRIGYLTKTRADAESRAETLARENEAMRQLLAAQGKEPPAAGEETPPTPPAVPAARTYTDADVETRAAQIAAAKEFNRRADEVFLAGKDKFGDWQDSIDNLNASGFMSANLAGAAMESGAPTDVLHHLGSDLAEAERISALEPVRMGVEIAKLANKLAAPKQTPISRAPAPITPVNGAASPVVDFGKLAEGDDMSAYVAARQKAGDPWANSRRRS